MVVPWILIAVLALIIVFLIVFFVRKDKRSKKLTPLASLSFILVIAGIIFGDNRFLTYSLIGAGVVLAVIDMVLKMKKR